VLLLAVLAHAQTFTTLYNFTGGSDGANPDAGVIQDPAGSLYGTTEGGGSGCCGVVFKLDLSGNETVLHSFTGSPDGAFPYPPVVRDSNGNGYGVAANGGSAGYGVVFKVDTAGNETVLYNFTGGSDGCSPEQGLVVGKFDSMYGTAGNCGSSYRGTIFKIDSAGNFTLLHSFIGGSSDGAYPAFGRLTISKSGNLYGATLDGGASDYGVLYKLTKKGRFTVLHGFTGGTSDGCYPYGSVAEDKAGDFYGTTEECGSNGVGTIWKVSKKGKETILHNFARATSDGCYPVAGVTRDRKTNVYGVTPSCGANGYGALYELNASGQLTLLHSFDDTDGARPFGEVWLTDKGALFGTTFEGGTGNCSVYGYDGCGTVWSYVP
jgi:uncharacterized repeat protein (TIGR03803 family)